MDILISGAGIAGLTTAYWLRRYGRPIAAPGRPRLDRGTFIRHDLWSGVCHRLSRGGLLRGGGIRGLRSACGSRRVGHAIDGLAGGIFIVSGVTIILKHARLFCAVAFLLPSSGGALICL